MRRRRLSDESRQHYRDRGWLACEAVLPDALLEPVRKAARTLAANPPWPEMLSGIHNPFGFHACTHDAWSFLAVGESAELVDVVAELIGPDLILWDSELVLRGMPLSEDEPQLWPVEPLAGALVLIAIENGHILMWDVTRRDAAREVSSGTAGAQYVLRYMPATSHFYRDPCFPANQRAAEARALVNYATRPIWLVRGEDRARNDFATGFSVPAARWGGATDGSRPDLPGNGQQEKENVA